MEVRVVITVIPKNRRIGRSRGVFTSLKLPRAVVLMSQKVSMNRVIRWTVVMDQT